MRVIARVRIHDNVHQMLRLCVMQGPHKHAKKILPSFLFYRRSLVAIVIDIDVTIEVDVIRYDAAGTEHCVANQRFRHAVVRAVRAAAGFRRTSALSARTARRSQLLRV